MCMLYSAKGIKGRECQPVRCAADFSRDVPAATERSYYCNQALLALVSCSSPPPLCYSVILRY